MIDLSPEHLAIVQAILRQRTPTLEVWAFGSRVRGIAKPHSNLDLAFIGEEPLSTSFLADLAEDFSESDLPFRVDLVDWASTGEPFRRIIECEHSVLQIPQAAP